MESQPKKAHWKKTLVVGAALPLAFVVSACSSNSTPAPSPSVPSTPATATSTGEAPTSSPTDNPQPTSTATSQPTNATGSPTGNVQSLNLQVSATSAKPGQRINLVVAGPKSLAGKQVAIVDMIAPDKYKIFSKLTLNSQGQANGYLILGTTDGIQAFVPTNPVSGTQWNPGQPILAQSGMITITVK